MVKNQKIKKDKICRACGKPGVSTKRVQHFYNPPFAGPQVYKETIEICAGCKGAYPVDKDISFKKAVKRGNIEEVKNIINYLENNLGLYLMTTSMALRLQVAWFSNIKINPEKVSEAELVLLRFLRIQPKLIAVMDYTLTALQNRNIIKLL